MKRKCLIAAALLISAASSASAQTYWSYGDYGPWARGYYGTPMTAGRNMAAAAVINPAMAPVIATRAKRPAATVGAETTPRNGDAQRATGEVSSMD